MTTELIAATGLRPARSWAIVVVPVGLALLGALLRYLAYASLTPHPTPADFTTAMCVWDCYWYGEVAQHGYQAYPETLNFGGPAGIADWAFFPLYPLLIAALQKAVALPPTIVGAILSPLLTLAAVLASWPLFGGERRPYFLFGMLLLAGPFSFYFAVAYSESLFLLLTIVALVALSRRHYVATGLAAALLSATRTVGVLFVFAILAECLIEWRERRLTPRQVLAELPRRPDMLLGLLLAPLGLFAFMAWLYLVTGDALAFVHIQRAWDRNLVSPVVALWAAFLAPGGQVRDGPLLALASLAGLALSGALAWQRQLPAALFCTLSLVLALTNGVESMLRFVVALAPLAIMLCQMLARWRWLFWLAVVVFAGLDFQWTIAWLQQQGALM